MTLVSLCFFLESKTGVGLTAAGIDIFPPKSCHFLYPIIYDRYVVVLKNGDGNDSTKQSYLIEVFL